MIELRDYQREAIDSLCRWMMREWCGVMKKCTKCGQEKPYSCFFKYNRSKDGYKPRCKLCQIEDQHDYVSRNIEKVREYRRQYSIKNRDSLNKNSAKWRKMNPEKAKEVIKNYKQKNSDKIAKKKKEYNEKNKELNAKRYKEWSNKNKNIIAEKDRKWYEKNKSKKQEADRKRRIMNRSKEAENSRKRYQEDSMFNFKKRVRARINGAFRRCGYSKKSKTSDMIGCSFEYLCTHIEELFVDGMSWSNKGEWHIDHIIPLASASTEEELIDLCHYTNLQPLWASENMSKGCKK